MKKNELDNLVRLFGSQVCYPEIREYKEKNGEYCSSQEKNHDAETSNQGKTINCCKGMLY